MVQNQTSRDIEDIIDIMIGRGSPVTRAEALSVIEEYEAAIAQVLADGDRVNTPLFQISASIPGIFEGPTDSPEPVPQVFTDVASDTTGETLTPGGVGQLNGTLLKIDPEDEQQGVFFITTDGTETRSDTYIRNKPANLIFMIPEGLASGEYIIEVRTQLRNTNGLRTGQLDNTLVAP